MLVRAKRDETIEVLLDSKKLSDKEGDDESGVSEDSEDSFNLDVSETSSASSATAAASDGDVENEEEGKEEDMRRKGDDVVDTAKESDVSKKYFSDRKEKEKENRVTAASLGINDDELKFADERMRKLIEDDNRNLDKFGRPKTRYFPFFIFS
jgi:hypothetical protein